MSRTKKRERKGRNRNGTNAAIKQLEHQQARARQKRDADGAPKREAAWQRWDLWWYN